MLSKNFKSQEDFLEDPQLFTADFTRIPQRRLWKTWSLNLESRILLNNRSMHLRQDVIVQKMMRKYYGKKILFVIRAREKNGISSRSKLLKYVKIEENNIYRNNLRYKGNVLMLGRYLCFRDNEKIYSKRILKYCQKAYFRVYDTLNLRLLVCMMGLKHLSMKIFLKPLEVFSFNKVIKNLLSLETIRLDFHAPVFRLFEPRRKWECLPKNKSFSKGFFSQLHKLFCLKKVKLIFNDQSLIDDINLGRDLENFYSQPLNFVLHIRIVVHKWLEIENNVNLAKIIRAAEFLCLDSLGGPELQMRMSKEAKKRSKFGKRNLVEFWFRDLQVQVDVSQILSYCDWLESLYIKERANEFCWVGDDGMEEEIKGCENLKNIVLDFDNISSDDGYNTSQNSQMNLIENQRENSQRKFSSLLLTIICQIRKNCHALEDLSLYLTILRFSSLSWNRKPFESSLNSFLGSFDGLMQEISTFDKIKTFGLWTIPEDLNLVSLEKSLLAKHLETFQLKLCRKLKTISFSEWDNMFEKVGASQIKELKITISEQTKAPLFRMKILNFIRKVESLEVVELIDEDLDLIQFAVLNELITTLLEKKNMKRILICTRVVNNFSENFGDLNLRSLGEELQNLLVRDWEMKVKASQLEEISVGRLKGYRFDYLFYDKKMQIADKLFWSEEEMKRLLGDNEELRRRYQEIFGLFQKKEGDVW